MNLTRLAFALIYITVDVIYIMLAHRSYFDVVKKIQNIETRMDMSRYIVATLAYITMAFGWVMLVAPHIEQVDDASSKNNGRLIKALMYGASYGFVLYGVFNFTNYVMFQNYSKRIMVQDLVWGTSWVTVLSLLYAVFIN